MNDDVRDHPLVGVVIDRPGEGRQLSRLPDGTVKIEFVRIVDELPPDSTAYEIPNLWPEYLAALFKTGAPR
jgi:hypothetical protein